MDMGRLSVGRDEVGMEEGREAKRGRASLPPSHEPWQSGERAYGRRNEPFALLSILSLAHPVAPLRRSEHRQPQKRKRLRGGGDRVDGNWGREAERGDDDVCLELSAAQLHKTRLDGEEEKHEHRRGKGYISSLPFLPDADLWMTSRHVET